MDRAEIEKDLARIAYEKSEPFCYHCYVRVAKTDGHHSGRCPKCLTDDLMRITSEDGPEYGYDWVVHSLLRESLAPVNVDDAFEESVRQCYPKTTAVAWLELDTVSVLRKMDPVSWRIAASEWLDAEEQDETVLSFDNGGTHYWASDIEAFIDEATDTQKTA